MSEENAIKKKTRKRKLKRRTAKATMGDTSGKGHIKEKRHAKKVVKKTHDKNDKQIIHGIDMRYVAALVLLVGIISAGAFLLKNNHNDAESSGAGKIIEFEPKNIITDESNRSYSFERSEDFEKQLALCNQYIAQRDYNNTILCLKKADTIRTDPNVVGTIADVLAMTGQDNESLKYYMQMTELNPRDSRIRYNYALVLDRLNMTDDALKQYGFAIEINGNYTKAINNRGILFQKIGMFNESNVDFRRALEIDGNNSVTLMNYANLLADMGNNTGAEMYFNKAINADPGNKNVYRNFAQYFYNRGNYIEAKNYLEKSY